MNLRWIVSAAAWLAFSTAVWFVGDMLPALESAGARIAVIVVLALVFLAWEIFRARKAAAENEQLLAGLVGGSMDADSAQRAAAELQTLRKRFEDALGVLKKARFKTPEGEKRTVSQLPWYMFIGAPGSGKTTALLNAGLRFPLGDPRSSEQALQGVGGTRNCDWWFTEQAVLVDTAGRYTTQESDHQADSAAWLGFLDLLKRFRPRQPLNGVILTLSIADLVHWNEEEVGRYAKHVRDRVRELYTRLGVRLPIYLMVTKTDLLAGFTEFYSEFDAKQRAQVWGTTFDPTEQARGLGEKFKDEFGRLERRLYTLLPERLQETRDLQKRATIYRFPQQYRVAGPLIAKFLDTAFGGAWVGEAGLAGLNPAVERSQRLLRLAAYAVFAALAIGFGFVWTASFLGNSTLIATADAKTVQAKRDIDAVKALGAGDEAKLIALLDKLRDLRDSSRGGDSTMLRAGFYQGNKLGAQASRAYRNALRDDLLPDLTISLENALRNGGDGVVRDGYAALYDDANRDVEAIAKAAQQVWKLPDALKGNLSTHLREAFLERPLTLPRPKDESLVGKKS